MELDKLLSFLSRHLLVGRAYRFRDWLRRFYGSKYTNAPNDWTTISDFDGNIKLNLQRSSYLGGVMYWFGNQSPSELKLLSRILKPSMTFVDVGANQGEFTLFAAKRLPGGHVLAFEPIGAIYERLVENIRLNDFINVKTYQCALSDTSGKMQMYTSTDTIVHGGFNEGLASLFESEYRSTLLDDVEVKTLDEIVQQESAQIDVIKIDVEGAELFVLRGCVEILARYKPILILEINASAAKAAGYTIEDLYRFLELHGYQIHLIEHTGETHPVPLHALSDQCNVVCLHSGLGLQ